MLIFLLDESIKFLEAITRRFDKARSSGQFLTMLEIVRLEMDHLSAKTWKIGFRGHECTCLARKFPRI